MYQFLIALLAMRKFWQPQKTGAIPMTLQEAINAVENNAAVLDSADAAKAQTDAALEAAKVAKAANDQARKDAVIAYNASINELIAVANASIRV